MHNRILSCSFFLSAIYYMILMSCMYQSSCLKDIHFTYQSSFLMYGICMFKNMYHNQRLSFFIVHIPCIQIQYTFSTYSCHVYILHVFISCIHIPRIHIKYTNFAYSYHVYVLQVFISCIHNPRIYTKYTKSMYSYQVYVFYVFMPIM